MHTLGTLHEHINVIIQRVYILWYVQVYYMYNTYICAYYVFSTYADANNSGLVNTIIITIQTFNSVLARIVPRTGLTYSISTYIYTPNVVLQTYIYIRMICD